jgi:3-oxoacyl-[acyl-carrier protein] reductase
VHMTQLALRAMQPRKSGIIINIVGMAARQPTWDYICGATGNAALNAFTSAIGAKAVDFGIRVFGINPAGTRTDRIISMSKQRAKTRFGDESRWEETLTNLPFGRLKEPAEVAALTVMLSGPQVEYLAGTMIDMDGGALYRK